MPASADYNRNMFVDHAVIRVKAGKGGDGCLSFRREKYVPKGGPDGGNAGDGGDVIAYGDDSRHTLLDFQYTKKWEAPKGMPGRGADCTGAGGDDIVLKLPPGTLIYSEPLPDAHGAPVGTEADRELICDLAAGQRIVIARGGRGGRGNAAFKSPTNQTPREWEPGEVGEEKRIRLELKLIADVGFIGLPNAGKSTLLRAATRARPKVADYPFTTLTPQLGITEIDLERRMVLADIPGLIEGASDGAGLGHRFLRHVERTRVLVHVLDIEPIDGSDPMQNYETIRKELHAYTAILAEKPEIIAVNKIDLLGDGDAEGDDAQTAIAMVRSALKLGVKDQVFPISAATGAGVPALMEACYELVQQTMQTASEPGFTV